VVARLGLGPQAAEAGEPEAPPAEVDPAVAARQAEEALRRAEEAFEQSRYWDAIVTLEDETLPHAAGRTRQRARLLLAQCYRKNPKWTKRAEEQLRAALQDDPTDANVLFALGTLYKEQRVWSRSAAMFREVLALKPRHAAARAELESLPAAD
jgi:tetratricopeptide (TPR) repeat protein